MNQTDIEKYVKHIYIKNVESKFKNKYVKPFYLSEIPSDILFLSVLNIEGYIKIEENYLEDCINYMVNIINEDGKCDSSLASGIVGICFSLYHLCSVDEKYLDIFMKFKKLHDHLCNKKLLAVNIKDYCDIEESDYDLIHGISGNLLFLLNFSDEESVSLIKKIGTCLINLTKNDAFFIESPYISNSKVSFRYPSGYLNLGVSHGIIAPMYVLAKCYEKKIDLPDLKITISKLLTYYKEEVQNPLHLHKWKDRTDFKNKRNFNNRASWCYGSPGIARVLYSVGKIINDKNIIESTIDYFNYISNYEINEFNEFNFSSPTICHGYTGLLLIMDEMYRDTQNIKYKNLSDKLYIHVMDMINYDYDFYFYDIDKIYKGKVFVNNKNHEEHGILNGSHGVMLSLLHHIKCSKTNWTSIFLI